MARKITTGIVGGRILGSLSTEENTLKSITTGQNLVLSPNNAVIEAKTHIQVNDSQELRFSDGTNFAALTAPASVTASYTLTLPSTAGTNGYVMISDGSGNLSWDDIRLEVSSQNADPGPYYPMMTTTTSGTITAVSLTTGALSFNPTNGTLSATTFSGSLSGNVTGNVTGNTAGTHTGAVTGDVTSTGTSTFSNIDVNGGAIDGTTIGGASAANGTFATLTASSITETSSIAYKENVNPITNALEAIMELVGVTYDRKDGSSTSEAGLIAEDTANVLPNLVTFKDGKPEGINYTKLTAYLIEAVKELKSEINNLKR